MRTLSQLAIASQNTQNTDEVWLVLLRIEHASITPGGVIRIVNNMEDIVGGSDGGTYVGFPFQIDLPGEDSEQASVARLRLDNVDRQIVAAVRGLPSPPTVDIEVVLASQPTVVEIGFYEMSMRAATYDALYVDATLTFEAIYTEPCTLEMTPARFPGMF